MGQLFAVEAHNRMQLLQKRCPQLRRVGSSISCQQVGQSSLTSWQASFSARRLARCLTLLGKTFPSAIAGARGKIQYQSLAPSRKAEACSCDFDTYIATKSADVTGGQERFSIVMAAVVVE